MRKSIIWKIEKTILEDIVKESKSITHILRQIGFKNPRSGQSRNVLKKRMKLDGIDYGHLDGTNYRPGGKKLPLEEILVESSGYTSTNTLKKRLIKEGLLKNHCTECENPGFWRGKKLVLILDHINGISDDHRFENLRLLCPNCNSQTETFCRGNINEINEIKKIKTIEKEKKIEKIKKSQKTVQGKIKVLCLKCEKPISERTEKGMCNPCFQRENAKVQNRPSRTKLIELILTKPFTKIGEKYSVSDNSIRKWCKAENLPYRKVDIEEQRNEIEAEIKKERRIFSSES